MKIQCPKCGAIFQFDSNRLLSNENRFRCYKCEHMWIVDMSKYNGLDSENKTSRNIDNRINKKNRIKINSNRDYMLFLIVSAVLLFVIVSFLLVSNRAMIVKGLKSISLPSMSSRNIKKTELEIEVDIPIPTVRRGDKDFLIIKGRVINRTFQSQTIPPILIELKNKEKNVLWHIVKKLNKKYISPNSSENFTFIVEKYLRTVTNANVNFDIQKNK